MFEFLAMLAGVFAGIALLPMLLVGQVGGNRSLGDVYGAPFQICLPVDGTLAVATGQSGYKAKRAFKIIAASMHLRELGGTSGSTDVDVNKAGTSILSAAMSLAYDASSKFAAGVLASPKGYPSGVVVGKDDELTVDVDAIPGTASVGLKVFLDCIALEPDK